MTITTPHIETVRRVSILCKVKCCYLLIIPEDPFVHLFADINDKDINMYKSELEAWCGMKFRIYNESDESETTNNLKSQGKKILPINNEEIKKAEKNLGL